MLSNAYFLAKFRFDTAENEPAKNLQIFEKCIFRRSEADRAARDARAAAPTRKSRYAKRAWPKTKNAWKKNERPKTRRRTRGLQNQNGYNERRTTNYEITPPQNGSRAKYCCINISYICNMKYGDRSHAGW